jgi:hypothetical protein
MKSIVTENIREGAMLNPSDDKFRYYNMAENLLDYILSKKFPISVGIYGKWGGGKSVLANFMKQIAEERTKDKNEEEKNRFFKFDVAAFKNSGKDIFWYFIASISEEAGFREVYKKIWKSIKPVAGSVLQIFLKKYTGNDGAEIITSYFSNETVRKDLIKELQRKYQKGKNFIVIDNLDRLNPSDAVSFLEQLKSFLLIDGDDFLDNFAYIILCDSEIIIKEIKLIYGENVDVRDYLNKIIEVPFYLPSYRTDLVDQYIKSLINKEVPEEITLKVCSVLQNYGVYLPRDIKNYLLELDMIYIIAKARGKTEEYLISNLHRILILQITKTKFKSMFNFIRNNKDLLYKESIEAPSQLHYYYEISIHPDTHRDWADKISSKLPEDEKELSNIKILHHLLFENGLIVRIDNSYKLNRDIEGIYQVVDDVTQDHKMTIEDQVNMNDKIEVKVD